MEEPPPRACRESVCHFASLLWGKENGDTLTNARVGLIRKSEGKTEGKSHLPPVPNQDYPSEQFQTSYVVNDWSPFLLAFDEKYCVKSARSV